MPLLKINPKTLEFIISDKDLQRARIIAVLKAAANTETFKKIEKKEPGKHKILAVQLGNETFKLEEQPTKLTPAPTHFETIVNKPFSATPSPPTKKYEGNLNSMNVACACGQTHTLGNVQEFKTTTGQYTENLKGLGETPGTTYNPAANETGNKNLYQDHKGSGTTPYQGSNTTGTAGYTNQNNSGTIYTDKKKKKEIDY
ncbi:MAG: hypothetical protein Q7R56_00805 [Nanoarchaeota archaeon]|nr:hypothetical protein [Nanoarchaeota archaeon]